MQSTPMKSFTHRISGETMRRGDVHLMDETFNGLFPRNE